MTLTQGKKGKHGVFFFNCSKLIKVLVCLGAVALLCLGCVEGGKTKRKKSRHRGSSSSKSNRSGNDEAVGSLNSELSSSRRHSEAASNSNLTPLLDEIPVMTHSLGQRCSYTAQSRDDHSAFSKAVAQGSIYVFGKSCQQTQKNLIESEQIIKAFLISSNKNAANKESIIFPRTLPNTKSIYPSYPEIPVPAIPSEVYQKIFFQEKDSKVSLLQNLIGNHSECQQVKREMINSIDPESVRKCSEGDSRACAEQYRRIDNAVKDNHHVFKICRSKKGDSNTAKSHARDAKRPRQEEALAHPKYSSWNSKFLGLSTESENENDDDTAMLIDAKRNNESSKFPRLDLGGFSHMTKSHSDERRGEGAQRPTSTAPDLDGEISKESNILRRNAVRKLETRSHSSPSILAGVGFDSISQEELKIIANEELMFDNPDICHIRRINNNENRHHEHKRAGTDGFSYNAEKIDPSEFNKKSLDLESGYDSNPEQKRKRGIVRRVCTSNTFLSFVVYAILISYILMKVYGSNKKE